MGRNKGSRDRPKPDGSSNRKHPKPNAGRKKKGENCKLSVQPFVSAKIVDILGSIEAVKAFIQNALNEALAGAKLTPLLIPQSEKGKTVGIVGISLTKGELTAKFEASKHLVRCWCINLVNEYISNANE